MDSNKILVYDIETSTFGRPNPEKDVFRIFGCYSYITNKYYFLTNREKIEKIINAHKFLVTYNGLQYDNNVLKRFLNPTLFDTNNYNDTKFKYKINIDLYQIIKNRASSMKISKGMLGDLLIHTTLDYVTKTIEIVDDKSGKIKDFDYSILNKEVWTNEEKKTIIEYLKRDVELTKKLYDWLEEYFQGFKDFLSPKDVENKVYLTCAISVFAYKAICNALGIEEKYSNRNKSHKSYSGGYIAYPAGEYFHGDIYCLDYNSLYPSIMHQCNIYSPVEPPNGWHGNNVFHVEGYYNDKEQGKVEKLIKKWYEKRLIYKKNKDPREYSIKIIINTMYGLLGNENFVQLSNITSASDVTSLARQWIMLARKRFREAGYKLLYTDTDSVYLLDPFHDKERLLEVKNKIIEEIKANIPFPYEHFDMGIDDEITDIWFFKGKNINTDDDSEFMDEDDYINKPKGFMKKNYLYITKDGKVKYKNLGVKKKSTSLLVRKIFNDYLIPKIKEEKKVKFSKTYFRNLINKLLEEDLSLAARRYNVNRFDTYKSPTSLQAQIAKKYGQGVHFLICNKKYGVGKKYFYCTIDEFKEHGLKIDDIILDSFFDELSYFIESNDEHKNSTFVDLSKWC